MATQKDSARTAASAGNIDNTAYWGVVNRTGQSVRATLAQIKTVLGVVSSMTGDVTASVAAGVATTTIGALKVVNSMIADAAVTYAKIQNVSATNKLLGRATAGAGSAEELAIDTAYFGVSAGTINAQNRAAVTVCAAASGSQHIGDTLTDVTGLSLSVAANTTYYFDFVIFWVPFNTVLPAPKFSVSVPASPTSINFQTLAVDMSSNVGYTSRGAASNGGASILGSGITPSDSVAVMRGILVNGANAGTIQLRAAAGSTGDFVDVYGPGYGGLNGSTTAGRLYPLT